MGASESLIPALGASILERFLPGADVIAGILGNKPPPLESLKFFDELCRDWQIPKLSECHVLTMPLGYKIRSDVDLIVEDIKVLKQLNCDSPRVQALKHSSSLSNISEILTLPEDQIRRRFARIVGEYIRYSQTLDPRTSEMKISAFVPYFEVDFNLSIAAAQFEANINQGLVIDCDFRANFTQPELQNVQILKYDPKSFDFSQFKNLSTGTVLVPAYEVSGPERILASREWIFEIQDLSRFRAINLVTAPRVVRGKYLPDSYIACGPANSIKKIGL